jgi:hypothetical protein
MVLAYSTPTSATHRPGLGAWNGSKESPLREAATGLIGR